MQKTQREPVDRVLLGMIAAGILLVPWLLFAPITAASSWVVQTAIDVLTVVFAVRLFRLRETNRAARRFWVAVAAAMGFSGIGDAYQTVLVLTWQDHGAISPVQTGLVVAGMVCAVVTMMCHPLGGTGRQRLRLWLDAATVLTAVAVFLWYFVLADQVLNGRRDGRLDAAATALSMMLVSFGLVKLTFSPTSPFTRAAGVVGSSA